MFLKGLFLSALGIISLYVYISLYLAMTSLSCVALGPLLQHAGSLVETCVVM